MSEERIKERCKREDIAIKVIKGFLEKDCYSDSELFYSLKTLLDLYNKQKEEIENLEDKYAKLEHKYKRLKFDHKFHIEFTRKEKIDRGRILKEISDLYWEKDEKSKFAMEILEKLANERYEKYKGE